MHSKRFFGCVLSCCVSISNVVHAGILAASTRVVYDQEKPEQSLVLVNTNEYPVLTQLWVDDGTSNLDFKETPFVVLPPVFKLSPAEIKGIRIIYNGKKLPQDRESLFWLNLYEIPSLKKSQMSNEYVNLAMNTQLKVFFRPQHLKKYDIDVTQNKIIYDIIQNDHYQLRVSNPTPYHLNYSNITIFHDNKFTVLDLNQKNTVKPFSKEIYDIPLSGLSKKNELKIHFILIDDQGVSHPYSAPIS